MNVSLSPSLTHPQLVVLTRRTLLHERTVVRGYVPVMGVSLQHVDLQLDFVLLVLQETRV